MDSRERIPTKPSTRLAREMGLLGLTATGVCSMVGAGINVIPFMIQRNVPGIGPHVLTRLCVCGVAGRPGRACPTPSSPRPCRAPAAATSMPAAASIPYPRVRRLVLAMVLALRRDWRGVVRAACRSCATSRSRSTGSSVASALDTRRRAADDLARRVVDGGRRQPARRRALRAADRAADVPDVPPRRRGDRGGLRVRSRRLCRGPRRARREPPMPLPPARR